MKTSDAQNRARNKWNSENMEKITATVKKGYREKAKRLAEQRGLSMNALICALIDEGLGET